MVRVPQSTITEDDIGFSFAPRVNAASRMGTPHTAFKLFTTRSESEAATLAKELDSLNTKRKSTTATITKALKKRIDVRGELPSVIVCGSVEWKPALLGSVATTLVQAYKRPVCLWGREETGILKGSARTDGSVSVVTLLSGAGDVLLHSGGHAGAGGFAIDETQLHILEERLCASHTRSQLVVDDSKQKETTPLPFSLITPLFIKEISVLRPFGEGNRKPLWQINGTIESIRAFGKDKNHTEILLKNDEGKTVRTFRFFTPPEALPAFVTPRARLVVTGTLEQSAFSRGVVEFKIESFAQ
jgi:single-stranded-DNA-specific exonuclease